MFSEIEIDQDTLAQGGTDSSKPRQTVSSPLQANVLDNIAGDTPAIPWSELKEKWAHLQHLPFESVSRRCQIDVIHYFIMC